MLAELALLLTLYTDQPKKAEPKLVNAINRQVERFSKNGYVKHSFNHISEYEGYVRQAVLETGTPECLDKGAL